MTDEEKQQRIKVLLAENKKLQQKVELLEKIILDKEKKESRDSLKGLSKDFMKNVASKMGWFGKRSSKKNLFIQLITKLVEKKNPMDTHLVCLLKNFINLACMNRYNKKGEETHSGKACVNFLNDPIYEAVKKLLFPNKNESLVYTDLLDLVSGGLTSDSMTLLLASSRYSFSMFKDFRESLDLKSGRSIFDCIVYNPSN